ncbi:MULTISPECIES: type II secretion system ATPase GspE [unclassified Wenzhouxiangella]|uniref:type II secretion system ATPase GspE n=1 Tax=unclassified Wenzhouxiangella TaxID=2613841 RepID=UPI000E328EB9|nr:MULTISPECIES: type II secretion system ATPase GspE [unclassified Wenzhouxiangella]RFF26542.1 type II secretion system protein GspE [Wenzhouxiangella sp. 15181]RFP67531.1 type II secretion system protein GspE [Wenzhouxiangella sp. 15190]
METEALTATDETELLPSIGDHLEDRAADLCKLMIEQDRLREEDLQRAKAYREQHGGNLLTLLVRLGLVSERDLARAQSELLEIPMVGEKDYPESGPRIDSISVRYMKQQHLVPVRIDDDTLEVVMADPCDEFALRALGMATGREVKPRVGVTSEIDNTIERYFGGGKSAMGQIAEHLGGEGDGGDDEEDVEHLRDLASEAPVIRLVNLLLQRGVESRASDIHIEPFENRLKVRYRIDGVLQEVEAPPARSTAAVISRVKIMARLNIAERRLPQDGRIMHRVGGKELDLRVSTVPTAHGESVVMRILDREAVVLDFGSLGFAEDVRENFIHELEVPHGIILVTGPTGSGKTTTLYTALSRLNTPERKIITVEDPVEYQLEGVNQIQAKSSIGLDFARALRSIVRQDPDVIMIGEMRDLETAKIAIQSALTGHLVLSTLHTNDAAGGVTRMIDMGVEDYLLTSTVNAIMAQRLVRRLDPETMEAYEVLPEMIKELGLDDLTDERPIKLYRPGTSEASPTGYRGRTGIHELLVLSEEIRRMVMKHAISTEIEKQARAEGMRTMYEDGLMKALQGITSAEEVLRVTQEA